VTSGRRLRIIPRRRRTIVIAVAVVLVLAIANAAQKRPDPAPDPGGDEAAVLGELPADKELGFNDSFGLEGLGSRTGATLISDAGGNAVRMPMQWWGMEPGPGEWDERLWAEYERAYDDFVAEGIRPHFSITHAPPWAREPEFRACLVRAQCNYPPAREQLHRWERFMSRLATRFPQAWFGIWNEPNFVGSWRSGPDPERYAELLAVAYGAVKSASADAGVLGPGLGSVPKPDGLDYRSFLDRAYAAPLSFKDHADAIELHVYPGPNLGAGSFFARVLDDVREVRAAYGDRDKPIYVTEVGATTSGPNPVDEEQQADVVSRATTKLLTMPDVIGVLVHRLVEVPTAAETDPEKGFGLVRLTESGDPEPKLAYCALGAPVAPC